MTSQVKLIATSASDFESGGRAQSGPSVTASITGSVDQLVA